MRIAQPRDTPTGVPAFQLRVEGRSPDDPGLPTDPTNPTTPLECRADRLTGKCDTLAGSDIISEVVFPGVFGTACLDTRSKKQ